MDFFLSPAEIRRQAPTLTGIADRIGRRVFWPVPVKDGDGFDEFRQMGLTEWLAIIQLLQGLLTVFAGACGKGSSPEQAAAWLRDKRPWTFKRLRLRRAIAMEWGGSLAVRRHLTQAIEEECDRATGLALVPAFQEASLSL